MAFLKRFVVPVITGAFLVVSFVSCEEDLITIGEGVIVGEPFNTDSAVFDVFATNRNIASVQTNKLPVYQLGVFSDPVYNATKASITSQVSISPNPLFGTLRQDLEDGPDASKPAQIQENETVKEVFLYIPYLSNQTDADRDGVVDSQDSAPNDPNNDSDQDGVSNAQEVRNNTDPLNPDTDGDGTNDNNDDSTLGGRFAKVFDLDSIYIAGKPYASPAFNADPAGFPKFNLKVERSTFFLRDLDPNTNFEESQEYFSSQEFAPTFTDEILFDGEVAIDNREILFIVDEDDPDTEEDERGTVSRKENPGIRVPLDNGFFQRNILDKEGSTELFTNANFTEFFRGIHMSVDSDVLLLLDLTRAKIDIVYTHDTYNTAQAEVQNVEKTFTLNLLGRGVANAPITGNAVNTFVNDAYPVQIQEGMDEEGNASRIYLKGGAGSYAEIKLFDDVNGREALDQIKANNWIINEANLVFYVDNDLLNVESVAPPRLYLYNTETNAPLYNGLAEPQPPVVTPLTVFPTYDGLLNDDGQTRYKIRITDYISNLVLRETVNPTLGLSVSANVDLTFVSTTMLENGEESDTPLMATISPLGTVLFGNNVTSENEDRKLKLEIFYTEAN